MQATDFSNKLVSEIVRDDYRTAPVFKSLGLNFCCGGNVPLIEACEQKGIGLNEVKNALQKATTSITLPGNIRFDAWQPDFLIDYIINVHHHYLKNTLPNLSANFNSFVNSHQKKFPELPNILQLFTQLADTINRHCLYEEGTAFPYCKHVINTYKRKETYGSLFVKTFKKPLAEVIEQEKKETGDLLNALRAATNYYSIPENACTNYQVLLHQLKELDNDLEQHKHLENNILFPKVLQMEKELLQV